MITAETITDEQIANLRIQLQRAAMSGDLSAPKNIAACNLALNLPTGLDRDQWRAKCAAILNARTVQP